MLRNNDNFSFLYNYFDFIINDVNILLYINVKVLTVLLMFTLRVKWKK